MCVGGGWGGYEEGRQHFPLKFTSIFFFSKLYRQGLRGMQGPGPIWVQGAQYLLGHCWAQSLPVGPKGRAGPGPGPGPGPGSGGGRGRERGVAGQGRRGSPPAEAQPPRRGNNASTLPPRARGRRSLAAALQPFARSRITATRWQTYRGRPPPHRSTNAAAASHARADSPLSHAAMFVREGRADIGGQSACEFVPQGGRESRRRLRRD